MDGSKSGPWADRCSIPRVLGRALVGGSNNPIPIKKTRVLQPQKLGGVVVASSLSRSQQLSTVAHTTPSHGWSTLSVWRRGGQWTATQPQPAISS